MSSHTYNNKNTPGGRRRTGCSIAEVKKGKVTRYNPPRDKDFLEERRQSIAQLRVAERLAEEQQSIQTGITDDSPTTQE